MATVNPAPSPALSDSLIRLTTEFTMRLTPFDQREYRKLIEARAATMERVVAKLKPMLGLVTALDAGCGVGFFSQTLAEAGLNVCGFDGRMENIEEARNRFPRIPFEQADLQDRGVLQLGRFDFVLCFGLLYHLENPLLAIRHLRALTEKCLLVESMCLPEARASMMLREEPRQSDQSLREVAWCPSEGSLVKMLYRAGYKLVYKVTPLPEHDDFCETAEHTRRRTVLLASSVTIDAAGFRIFPEPFETADPWAKKPAARPAFPTRVARFLGSPARRQYLTMALRARRVFPGMAIPLRLPFQAWWLAEKSALDHELMYNEFETAETGFVQKLLRPGMTVLDVGAHHGLYTLLASKKVGRNGRVIAFEASPRECRRLEKHVRFNRCSNVHIEQCAVGSEPGEADLFLVDGFQDWCNSLRPPDVPDPTHTVRVPVRRADAVLAERQISKVDFIKLDVEGAEKAFLQGATQLLQSASRPAILAEVQDVRTRPWGYPAREIIQFLIGMDYRWFAIAAKGALLPISCDQESYDANLVALPVERTAEFLGLLGQK